MSLMDILQQYSEARTAPNPDRAHADFDQVSDAAPADVLGQGLGDAFRSDATPPFGDMVSHMFGQSDPQQKAGMLNQLIRSLGPAVLASLAGGVLGRMGAQPNAAAPQVTPDVAQQVTPEQVKEIAAKAEQHDPSVMDRVGNYYAQHPQIVKTLGSAALAIALAGISNRMRRQ